MGLQQARGPVESDVQHGFEHLQLTHDFIMVINANGCKVLLVLCRCLLWSVMD